ncbi:hypothetical protein HID58_045769 [Brassica napus]|uniref:Proteasomal ATPase second OB domain-containing protein n=1 Tax=Brassica napus TaxID=3708 RepID=A0ABQ8AUH8_BRANA|nr:hypothetical protein HID58_045769 [Brassica napus]
MPLDARRRTAAVANYRKKNSKELESRVRTDSNQSPCGLAARDNLRGSKKEFNKTEDDLKSLQMIVKASSGPRYVVGCRSKVDKEKLISATRVVLDMTTLTIMRALPREAFTQHLSINMGDAEEVSQHYRLMSRHTRDCLGVSFRCYAYIPVSGQEYVQLSDCLIETLNKDEVY